MRNLLNTIYNMSHDKRTFYGSILALTIFIIGAVIAYSTHNEPRVMNFVYMLFLLGLTVLIYVDNFAKLRPLWLSLILAIAVASITGIITTIYLIAFKGDKGFTLPIALITQYIIANLVKRIVDVT